MNFVLVAIGALAFHAVSTGPIEVAKRINSNSWAGSNLYFLQGLSDADQTTYIENLASYGAKVVRVWVKNLPGGNACVKGSYIANAVPALETTLGVYNNATLDALDKVLYKLQQNGLKALISPHDANTICGIDPYCSKWGPGYFYELQEAFDQYDQRLSYILNYQSPSTGKRWKDWSEAIMAFDLQAKPYLPLDLRAHPV
jgi:mannan endo-1,4-beta-mannosidase